MKNIIHIICVVLFLGVTSSSAQTLSLVNSKKQQNTWYGEKEIKERRKENEKRHKATQRQIKKENRKNRRNNIGRIKDSKKNYGTAGSRKYSERRRDKKNEKLFMFNTKGNKNAGARGSNKKRFSFSS